MRTTHATQLCIARNKGQLDTRGVHAACGRACELARASTYSWDVGVAFVGAEIRLWLGEIDVAIDESLEASAFE